MGLPKLTIVVAITPRKGRRMASILYIVVKSTKMPTPISTEAFENKIEGLEEVAAQALLLHVLKLDLQDLSSGAGKGKSSRRANIAYTRSIFLR